MVEKYSDPCFVRKIFANEKMDLKSKLTFIKFLERIRMSAICPVRHTLWKERFWTVIILLYVRYT